MIKCQHSDCLSPLDVLSIPVEFEAIIKQIFAKSNPALAHRSGREETVESLAEDDSEISVDALRDCATRGDHIGFALQVAELCSSPCGVQLPQCDSCIEIAVKERTRVMVDSSARRDAYLSILQSVSSCSSPASESSAGMDEAACIKLLQEEQRKAIERLAVVKQRCKILAARSIALRSVELRCARLESNAWRDAGCVRTRLMTARDRLASIMHRDDRLRWSLGRLRGLSVLSDAFFIWHRGPFVTINSARLGRLPGQPVEWPEINAALGQFALALCVTAQRVGFVFQKYRIVPMGSYARLFPVGEEAYAGGRGLDVFWSPGALLDGNLGLAVGLPFFSNSKLNAALKALFACLAEFGSHAEGRDPSFRLPHPLTASGEKVGDLHTAMGKDVPWTRAMKLAATDLKWLIAWAHKQPLP